MLTTLAARARRSVFSSAILLLAARPAYAQYKPPALNDPATGESYHIEGGVGFWNPSADIVVASQGLNIVGTDIDFKRDLGLSDKRLPEVRLVLRPARRHKFRLEYVPIQYDQAEIGRAHV